MYFRTCAIALAVAIGYVVPALADTVAVWPAGQIEVRQKSDGQCVFTIRATDGSFSQMTIVVRDDGIRQFGFSAGADITWRTAGKIYVNIDGDLYNLNTEINDNKNWLTSKGSLTGEFWRALYNGNTATVRAGDHVSPFSLQGTAVAMTVLYQCGEAVSGKTVASPAPIQLAPPAPSPIQLPPTLMTGGVIEAAMTNEAGSRVAQLNVMLNGATTVSMTLDSGAGLISLSRTTGEALFVSGTLTKADFVEMRKFSLADGSISREPVYRLRSVTVGGYTVKDVLCSIGGTNSALLLGKSFLDRFKSWSVDNRRNVLVLTP